MLGVFTPAEILALAPYFSNRWNDGSIIKLPTEEYRAYVNPDEMIETLQLLGYHPIYLVDYEGKVIWYIPDRYSIQ